MSLLNVAMEIATAIFIAPAAKDTVGPTTWAIYDTNLRKVEIERLY